MLAQRSLFCLKLLTTPSAPLRNGIFLLVVQPPLLENGGEWTRLAKAPFRYAPSDENRELKIDQITRFPPAAYTGLPSDAACGRSRIPG